MLIGGGVYMSKRMISIILVFILTLMTIPFNLSYALVNADIAFELDKDSFTSNEEIKGTGTVKKEGVLTAGTYVTITVEDNEGLSLFKAEQYMTDAKGSFTVSFKLPYDMESGNYLLKINSLGKELVKKFEYSTDINKPNKPNKPSVPTTEEKDTIRFNINSDSISLDIPSDVLKSIIGSKRNLKLVSNEFTLFINYDIFDKVKDFPLKLKIEKKNKNVGNNLTQASPLFILELLAVKGDKTESIKLNGKSLLMINYSGITGLDLEKACIYQIDENGNPIALGGRLNRDDKYIQAEIDSLGQFVILIYDKKFMDDDVEWAKDFIEVLAARHIISGVDNDNFKPFNNITRAEFCKMLISTLDSIPKDSKIVFGDVDKSKWYYEYINAAAALGLVEGYDGMFKPDDFITREAMVTMVLRAARLEKYGQSNMSGDLSFEDSDSISDWSREAILFAKQNGIIKGVGNNKFEPKKNATRAEVAVIVYKLLKLKGIF